eukprot:COSAG04_NODE_1348_length_7133_cov_93.966022_4_plen_117_part_00
MGERASLVSIQRHRSGVRTQRKVSSLSDLSSACAESGIALTVLRSTFFRNFAAWIGAGLMVQDAWPFVGVVSDIDFTHNDATLWVQDGYYWTVPVRTLSSRVSWPLFRHSSLAGWV